MPPSVAAFFDVDGTITQTTIIDPLVWYQRAHLSRLRFGLWASSLILQAPRYWLIDRRSRGAFNIAFYRRYAGLNADELRAWHRDTFADNLKTTIFPAAIDCIRVHQQQGHRIVLVTGALDFVMQPLVEFIKGDDLIAIRLAERDAVLSGELQTTPIADEHKATLVREYARKHLVDLSQSFAYGNSGADAPMLDSVGHGVAVNADRRLESLARNRNWSFATWESS